MRHLILDLIYPPVCELCKSGLTRGSSLCAPCQEGLPRIREPFCQICGEVFDGNLPEFFTCPNCQGIPLKVENKPLNSFTSSNTTAAFIWPGILPNTWKRPVKGTNASGNSRKTPSLFRSPCIGGASSGDRETKPMNWHATSANSINYLFAPASNESAPREPRPS